MVPPSCLECKARIWGRFRKSIVARWLCPQRDWAIVGGRQWGEGGVGCGVHIMYVSSLVKSHQKYTHPSLLPTGMLYASKQPSVELRKCLLLGQGNAKHNNKTKELSSFDTLERESFWCSPMSCFIFVKDQDVFKFLDFWISVFSFLFQGPIHLDVLYYYRHIHWCPLNTIVEGASRRLCEPLCHLRKAHPRENEGSNRISADGPVIPRPSLLHSILGEFP